MYDTIKNHQFEFCSMFPKQQIQNYGIAPDSVTFTCNLKVCSSIGALDKGKQIHDDVVCRGLHDKDVLLGTALINIYAKCGMSTN